MQPAAETWAAATEFDIETGKVLMSEEVQD